MAKDEHGREYIDCDDGVRRYTGLIPDNRVLGSKSGAGMKLGIGAAAIATILGYWALKGFDFKREVDLPVCERKAVGTYTSRMFGEDLKGTLYTSEGKEVGSLAFERKKGKWVLNTERSDIADLVQDATSVSGIGSVLSSGKGAYDAAKSGHYFDAFKRAAEGISAGKRGYECVAEIKRVGEKFD